MGMFVTNYSYLMRKILMTGLTKLDEVMRNLEALAKLDRLEALKHYAIPVEQALGISNPVIKTLAKEIGRNQQLSLQLWDTGIHEAQLLATLIGDHHQVSEAQMDYWITRIHNWAVCDGVCGNLFWKSPLAYSKAMEWTFREAEYEKRAGFALIAMLAVHDKKGDDKNFFSFFKRMEGEAYDERNFVKKAINWSLRQCGKRSLILHERAVLTATKISQQPSKSARWIAADALRELSGTAVHQRLQSKKVK